MLMFGQDVIGSGMNPGQLSGCVAWYDFTNSAYLTLATTAITQALDRSGNGNNTAVQGTGTARPTFTAAQINGLSAAVFDGGDLLVLPSALYTIPSGANTIFTVAKCTDNTQQRHVLRFTAVAAGRGKVTFGTAAGGGSGTTMAFANGAVTGVQATGTNTNFQITTCYRSGTTQSIQINNGTAVSDTNAIDGTGTDGAAIGASTGVVSPLIGSIAEILIYNRALSAAEIIQVNRYLARKYAITIS